MSQPQAWPGLREHYPPASLPEQIRNKWREFFLKLDIYQNTNNPGYNSNYTAQP